MKIAVIGAANVGPALASATRATGHDVTVCASDPANARRVAQEIGVSAAESISEAASGADAIVLAMPFTALDEVAGDLAGFSGLVIDATNPLNADMSGLSVTDRAGGQLVADALPDATVVKAFNTVFAANQPDPDVDGATLDGFYAGDDAASKATVAELLAAIGYRPVDAGPLSAALALEHMAFLNIALNANNGWSWRSGWKLVGPLA